MSSVAVESKGLQALGSVWLDGTSIEGDSQGCPVSDLLSWQGPAGADQLVGADFAAEVESVSRLFPHLDGLPAELTGLCAPGVAEQAAVCGETSVVLGAGRWQTSPGSPADPSLRSPEDQCLMSPSDALLASPDPSLAPSPARSELATAAELKMTSAGFEVEKLALAPAEIKTLIDFVPPAGGRATCSPAAPVGDGLVSLSDMETAPSPITDTTRSFSTETETAPAIHLPSPGVAAASPAAEFAQSPVIDFVSAPAADEEDEHTRMIDQALEDLELLESMCGITSDHTATATLASVAADSSASEATAVQSLPPPAADTPAIAAAPAAAAPAVATTVAVKQEPAEQEETEIEIVEERRAPRRRRRRPPRVAITPAAPPPAQIVIVLTSEQLAGIQKSGQIVLNAGALQPALAATEAATVSVTKPRTVLRRQSGTKAQNKGHAAGKAQSGKAQTVVKPSTSVGAKSGVKAETLVRPSTSSGRGQTVTKQAGKKLQTIVKQQIGKRGQKSCKRPASTEDPLSGWMEQKLPPQSSWEYPLLPAQALEQELPLDAGIPEDLQDVLLDETPAGAVPALPGDAADCLLEELISGSVRENPGLFDDVSPAEGGEVSCAALEAGVMMEEVPPVQVQSAGVPSPTPLLMAQPPVGFSLSPGPQQQLTLESWMPTLCPSPGESPVSPVSECSVELAPAPDWRPGPAARRGGARRPRPYDKETVRSAGRRQPLTEEEKRERKKEQNKNAATRYRQKKKEEHDIVSGDQEMLETRNKQLRERVGALSRELNYLKQLMREVLRHKRVGV